MILLRTMLYTSLANTQDTRMWLMVSTSWSQREQAAWCGSPRLASRSEVQHRLLMANQMKNLQFAGAQVFQILLQAGNLMEPKNIVLYADLLLYWPEDENFQEKWSGTLECRTIPPQQAPRLWGILSKPELLERPWYQPLITKPELLERPRGCFKGHARVS